MVIAILLSFLPWTWLFIEMDILSSYRLPNVRRNVVPKHPDMPGVLCLSVDRFPNADELDVVGSRNGSR